MYKTTIKYSYDFRQLSVFLSASLEVPIFNNINLWSVAIFINKHTSEKRRLQLR